MKINIQDVCDEIIGELEELLESLEEMTDSNDPNDYDLLEKNTEYTSELLEQLEQYVNSKEIDQETKKRIHYLVEMFESQ